MPTRIVLNVADKGHGAPIHHASAPLFFERTNSTTINGASGSNSSPRANESSNRRIVSLHTSIFRSDQQQRLSDTKRGLSTTDIRASPRLIGYIYQLLASIVLLLSVIKFYNNSEDETFLNINTTLLRENFGAEIYSTVAGPVYLWKLIGSAVVGSIGAGMTFFIVMVHFDTVCLPQLWMLIFRDRSKWEKNLLRFMVVFWAVSLHVCTSSLSVGEIQGNVLFTTWIAFAASVVNYGVWRKSAGLPSLAVEASLHHRETTYNWLWLSLCMAIFAGAATDIYFNRDELNLRFTSEGADLADDEWIVVLAVVWGLLALGLVGILLNHYSNQPIIAIRLVRSRSRIVLGWRHFEGIVIMLLLGVFFFLLIVYAGVDGVINGLTNSYFSLWGAFFNSVFLFGTWLRENKNIEYYFDDETFERSDEERKEVKFEHDPEMRE